MQLATTLQRGWQNRSQHPVVSTLNQLSGKIRHHLGEESFDCPCCGNRAPLGNFQGRKLARCLKCGALERHRLQHLVILDLQKTFDFSTLSLLQFAPDQLTPFFRREFKSVKTADIDEPNVDYPGCDIVQTGFKEELFDVVFASDVLEHVQDDKRALREIRRILKPNGFAVLHVPIWAGVQTVEYKRANPRETNHWRTPGELDYFNKHRAIFQGFRLYKSREFDKFHQLYIHEDRSTFNPDTPERLLIPGLVHEDFVPVCFKSAQKRESRGWEVEVKETEAVGA